jgi:hypothetical protein
MNRAAVIEQLKTTRQTLDKLLTLLESSEADSSRLISTSPARQYRRTSERPNKGNKAIEREIISSYQIAQSLGFNGDFRAWEHLLRIHE